ncbi:MAG: BCR, YceG family protein [Marinobacter sp. 34-60-7]|nr:MAG: BCR, YceG family protein [Marinobacter sp. 34-60-7]
MRVLKKLMLLIVVLGLLAGTAGGLWLWQGLKTLDQPIALVEPEVITVEPGTAFSQFARRLEQDGLVQDDLWIRLFGRLNPEQTRILAGDYEVFPGMTPRTLLQNLVDGKVKLWSVQFIEGWTFKDLRTALARSEHLEKVTTDWTDEQIMAELGAPDQHPEGWFFPDTYLFSSSETDLDVLRRAHNRMQDVLEQEWQGREEGLPYDSKYEALIMASIVERETGVPHERDQVAGVFVRRLEKGMRLQTDPTVIYGMGDAYQGRITRRDLRTATPYNTYRIDGLPPTPIAMPGRGAIHATLHPAEGDTYYFVARGDGSHKFSRTLAEHNEAVREFQLNRREDYRSFPAPESEAASPAESN